MPDRNHRICVVSDDSAFCQLIYHGLSSDDFSLDFVGSVIAHRYLASIIDRNIIVLDSSLHSISLAATIETIKQLNSDIVVIAVTPPLDVEGRVAALECGVDECISKELDRRELIARVRAVMRRSREQSRSFISAGTLTLDLLKREVTYGAKRIILPQQEFALLRMLAERANNVLSRDQLHRELYFNEPDISPTAIDLLIFYIRRKLGKDVILNVRGRGWALARSNK